MVIPRQRGFVLAITLTKFLSSVSMSALTMMFTVQAQAPSLPPVTVEQVTVVATSTPATPPKKQELQFKYPQLKRICSCESTGHPNREPIHYKSDGSVLRGIINSDDVGMCQINLFWNGEEAIALGFDLFKEEENLGYATWLYEHRGNAPWVWSKGCWG